VLHDTTTPVSSEMMTERDNEPSGSGGEYNNHNGSYEEEFVGFGGRQPSGNDPQQFNPFDSIPTSTTSPQHNNNTTWNVASPLSAASAHPPAYKEHFDPYNTHQHHHYAGAAAPSYADAFINRRYEDDEESIDFDIPIDIDDLVD